MCRCLACRFATHWRAPEPQAFHSQYATAFVGKEDAEVIYVLPMPEPIASPNFRPLRGKPQAPPASLPVRNGGTHSILITKNCAFSLGTRSGSYHRAFSSEFASFCETTFRSARPY
jgi:hypothetical protein